MMNVDACPQSQARGRRCVVPSAVHMQVTMAELCREMVEADIALVAKGDMTS